MKSRNITIVGAGNVGTQFAVHCAEKGHRVTVYSSKPEKIQRELTIVNENGEVLHQGTIAGAVSDPASAFRNADVIFVTVPAMLMKHIAGMMEPFAGEGMKICIVPGTGGGECAFKGCIEKGAVLFGVQRVPSVARLVEYGKTVCAVGYRDEMFAAALPHKDAEACRRLVEDIFDIRTSLLPNYLNITLTPSNPVLHTTRLKNLYRDYHKGLVYQSVPLFYEDWDDETSVLLLKCDDEVQELCRALDMFDLSYVKSLRVHYESPTAEELTKKISTITGFKGLPSPAVAVEGGYIPDLESRYFVADFPYGLSILVQIADFVRLDTRNMKETLDWYYGIAGKQEEFRFSDYGINTLDQFIAFYGM